MASLGSLPFGTTMEKSLLLSTRSSLQHRFSFFAFFRRNSLDSDFNGCEFGFRKVAEIDMYSGFVSDGRKLIEGSCGGKLWKRKGMRAAGVSGAETGGEDDSDADAPIQETVDSEKKVLAMEKYQLQQVAKMKQLVLPIKNNIIGTEEETVSYSGSAVSISNLEFPSTDEELDFDAEKEEPGKSYPLEKASSSVDSHEEFQETAQLTTPSLLPRTSETHGPKEEKIEEPTETNIKGVSGELDVAPEVEVKNPPPLAWENVMNIILVAAECAPWSKTALTTAVTIAEILKKKGLAIEKSKPNLGCCLSCSFVNTCED